MTNGIEMETITTEMHYNPSALWVARKSGKAFAIQLKGDKAYVMLLLGKYASPKGGFGTWEVPRRIVDVMEYVGLTRRRAGLEGVIMDAMDGKPMADKPVNEHDLLRKCDAEYKAFGREDAVEFDQEGFHARLERTGEYSPSLLTLAGTKIRIAIEIRAGFTFSRYVKLRTSLSRYLGWCLPSRRLNRIVVTEKATGSNTYVSPIDARALSRLRFCLKTQATYQEAATIVG